MSSCHPSGGDSKYMVVVASEVEVHSV